MKNILVLAVSTLLLLHCTRAPSQSGGARPAPPSQDRERQEAAVPRFNQAGILNARCEPVHIRPLPAPPAPGSPTHAREVKELLWYQASRNALTDSQVRHWDSGACLRWNGLARERVARRGIFPVRATRIYALVSLAQYQAMAAVTFHKRHHLRPAPVRSVDGLKPAVFVSPEGSYPSDHAAVAAASAKVLAHLFPKEDTLLFSHLLETHLQSRVWGGISYPSDIEAGVQIGEDVAAEIIRLAKTDGAAGFGKPKYQYQEDDSAYFPRNSGADLWHVDTISRKPPQLPQWGKIAPWFVTEPDKHMPPPPPKVGSPEFQAALEEVRKINRNPTAEQMRLAFHWADAGGTETPPGHWNEIAVNLLRKQNVPELEAARILAVMNMAMMDAGICCWAAKYKYRLLRPHQADASIKPLLDIPPFPAYPSGHSTFSGTAAEILGHYFPSERDTLANLALEAGRSRIYGGIHFEFDNRAGLASGRSIGRQAISSVEGKRCWN